MSGPRQELPVGVQTFAQIINNGLLYVDKTAYIAEMVSSYGTKAWFLARPRRFGKSLIVSTLESLFTGPRELFKSLAIEKRLGEEIFAPRPVISLDMSDAVTDLGVDEFRRSLARLTSSSAIWREDERSLASSASSPAAAFIFPPDATLSAAEILGDLIQTLSKRSGQRVAVLIDEYDKPILDFIKKPDEAEMIRETMRNYYARLKSNDKYISFIFISGISKFSRMSVFSAMNNLDDISIDEKYSAICGFTHNEFTEKFAAHLEETAIILGSSREDLLEKLKDYYDGFSFDGKTRVYNPFSALLFFKKRVFDNFWFISGTPQIIAHYLKDKRLTVEEFRGMLVPRYFISNPGEIDSSGPASFLYQSGYLSVRLDELTNKYTLDYPNREVYESMSRLLVDNYFDAAPIAEEERDKLRDALKSGEASALIEVFNEFLAEIPYDFYSKANRKTVKIDGIKINFDEWLYHSNILSFLIGAGVTARAEKHTSLGQSDLVAIHAGKIWVIELKMVRNDNDETVAKNALKQIRDKDYAGPYDNPILLGIAINESKRTIGAWEVGYKNRP
ncbi:MAG: ATP-binding protein [Deltaproteobacteria bacterium]|nr:ATP-binding protein [Deltaproteobacteria bacterium]